MAMQKSKPGIPAVGQFEIIVDKRVFRIDAPASEGYIIGRSDVNSSYQPDIDLVACNALEKGVSRRHAALVRYQGMIHILDLNSVNGTFLNGERLQPDIPYPLNTDDDLRLGTLNVTFIKTK
jgi:pSer/pThr/pTyr-binding forkhead associated (FHA) protein